MSTYVREKVLRIPVKYTGLVEKYGSEENVYDNLSKDFPDLVDYGEVGKFQLSPTDTPFLDFVLDYDGDADGEFGKIRDLYESERNKYADMFKKIAPDCDMSKVRLVEFCWYNCSEAPDYYDNSPEADPFFSEV